MKTKFQVRMVGVWILLLLLSPMDGRGSENAVSPVVMPAEEEDFRSFLEKFTSSAAFQYTRIKFPLKSPITLLADDEETEVTIPFTQEKWVLLDSEALKEERFTQEGEETVYVSKFVVDEPAHKVFEAGYEESEADLRVEFERQADGRWYVVDCYTSWYSFDLPPEDLKDVIEEVREENEAFKELFP